MRIRRIIPYPVRDVETTRGEGLRFSHKGDSRALVITFERDLGNRDSNIGRGYYLCYFVGGGGLETNGCFFLYGGGCFPKDKEGNRLDLVMDDEAVNRNLWDYEAHDGGRSSLSENILI